MSEDVGAEQSLDALVRRVDPDRWLSSRFISDPARRADVIAIYAFDHELARAPRVSNPLVGEMRLVWWREALEELLGAGPARRHPTAQALGEAAIRHDLTRADLEAMVEGRYRELDPQPMSAQEAFDWAAETAGQAAVLAARILDPGAAAPAACSAGAAWGLARALAGGWIGADAGEEALRRALAAARTDVRRLSIRAFPAAAHAALARRTEESDLTKRLRLAWAVARGRV